MDFEEQYSYLTEGQDDDQKIDFNSKKNKKITIENSKISKNITQDFDIEDDEDEEDDSNPFTHSFYDSEDESSESYDEDSSEVEEYENFQKKDKLNPILIEGEMCLQKDDLSSISEINYRENNLIQTLQTNVIDISPEIQSSSSRIGKTDNIELDNNVSFTLIQNDEHRKQKKEYESVFDSKKFIENILREKSESLEREKNENRSLLETIIERRIKQTSKREALGCISDDTTSLDKQGFTTSGPDERTLGMSSHMQPGASRLGTERSSTSYYSLDKKSDNKRKLVSTEEEDYQEGTKKKKKLILNGKTLKNTNNDSDNKVKKIKLKSKHSMPNIFDSESFFFDKSNDKKIENEIIFEQMKQSLELTFGKTQETSDEEQYMNILYEQANLQEMIENQNDFIPHESQSGHACSQYNYSCYTSFPKNTQLEKIGSSEKFSASGNVFICRKTKKMHVCLADQECDESIIRQGSNYCPISKITFGQIFNHCSNLSSMSKIENNKYDLPQLLSKSDNSQYQNEIQAIGAKNVDYFDQFNNISNNSTQVVKKLNFKQRLLKQKQQQEKNTLASLKLLKQKQNSQFEFCVDEVVQKITIGSKEIDFVTKMFLPFAKQKKKMKLTNYIYIVDQKTSKMLSSAFLSNKNNEFGTELDSKQEAGGFNSNWIKSSVGSQNLSNSGSSRSQSPSEENIENNLLQCLEECNILSDRMKKKFIRYKESEDNLNNNTNISGASSSQIKVADSGSRTTVVSGLDNTQQTEIEQCPTFSERYKMSSRKSSSFTFVEDFNNIFTNLNTDMGFIYFYNSEEEQPFYQMMQKFKKLMVHKNKIILVRYYEFQKKIVVVRDIYNIFKSGNRLKILRDYLKNMDYTEQILEEEIHHNLREADEEEEQMYDISKMINNVRLNNVLFSSSKSDEKSFLGTLNQKNEKHNMCHSVLLRYITSSMKHNKYFIMNLIVRKNITMKMLSSGEIRKDNDLFLKIQEAMQAIVCAKCILSRKDLVDRYVEILNNMWTSIFKTPQFSISRNGMRRNNFEKYSIAIISMMNEGFRYHVELFHDKLIEQSKLTQEIIDAIDPDLFEFNLTIIDEMEMIKKSIVHITTLKNIDPASKSIMESEFLVQNEEYIRSLGYCNQRDIEKALFQCLTEDEVNCCLAHKSTPMGDNIKTFCEQSVNTTATTQNPLIQNLSLDDNEHTTYMNDDEEEEDLFNKDDILFKNDSQKRRKNVLSNSNDTHNTQDFDVGHKNDDKETIDILNGIVHDKLVKKEIEKRRKQSTIEKRFKKSGQQKRNRMAFQNNILSTKRQGKQNSLSVFGRNYTKKTRRTSVNQLKEFIKTEIMICKKELYLLLRYNVEKIDALNIEDDLKKLFKVKKITDLLQDFKYYIKKLEC